MKKIRVAYADWWNGFNPDEYLLHQILKKHYFVEITDKPDYVFCSVYSQNYRLYDCVRIFYTGENVTPDFNSFDYAIGFDEMSFGDRYIRVPNYVMNPKYQTDIKLMLEKHKNVERFSQKDFCSFVCSNGNGNKIREDFFKCLSEYKKVNSGGRFLNNIGLPEGVANKLEFQKKHKFSLAFENSSQVGYTTEKIVQSFAAETIPIYWGDPKVGKYFNRKSFVNLHDYNSIDEVVKEIKRIDNDNELYLSMMKEPAMLNQNYISDVHRSLEEFLVHIVEQPIEKARRRTTGIWEDCNLRRKDLGGTEEQIKGVLKKRWNNLTERLKK